MTVSDAWLTTTTVPVNVSGMATAFSSALSGPEKMPASRKVSVVKRVKSALKIVSPDVLVNVEKAWFRTIV